MPRPAARHSGEGTSGLLSLLPPSSPPAERRPPAAAPPRTRPRPPPPQPCPWLGPCRAGGACWANTLCWEEWANAGCCRTVASGVCCMLGARLLKRDRPLKGVRPVAARGGAVFGGGGRFKCRRGGCMRHRQHLSEGGRMLTLRALREGECLPSCLPAFPSPSAHRRHKVPVVGVGSPQELKVESSRCSGPPG